VREGGRGFVDLDSGALRLKRVLMPIDGALNSLPAIRRVDRMLKLVSSGAEIQLFHVGERAPVVADEHGRPVRGQILVRQGRVIEAILKAAGELKVDAIAMPTAGRHGLLDAVRGSTTARILDDGRWPLLAVPVG